MPGPFQPNKYPQISLDLAVPTQNDLAAFSVICGHAWPQWPVTGATHQYNSVLDPCCPFQV
jgi:hypothetical protein